MTDITPEAVAGTAVFVRKITVPTDFSEPSQAALAWALAMARQFGASINLLHVLPYPVSTMTTPPAVPAIPIPSPAPVVVEQRRVVEPKLAEAVAYCESQAVPATSQLLQQVGNSFHKPIVEAAEAYGSDLIVMGTHGRTGVQRWLLGSVAEAVVRHSPIPVLTVPRRAPEHADDENPRR